MIRVTTTDFERQKFRTRRDNKNSGKISWKARKKPPKGHTKNIPFFFCTISKDGKYHILSSRVKSSEKVGFDSDRSYSIVDNSNNYHTLSEEEMFTNKIDSTIYNGVATICENDIIPKWIGRVSWYCTDEDEQLYTDKLNDVLYFPYSPLNILSATALDESIKDDGVTWVLKTNSIFTWDFGKYKNITAHSENCLPELDIQDSFSKFSGFFKKVGSISINYTLNFSFESIFTREYPITGNEYEVISDAVSQKLGKPLVNP